MKHLTENRREFLQRLTISAAAFPFLLNCKSSTLAQKTDKDVLSLIKKNANNSANCNWCGADGVSEDVTWKTALADEKDKGEKMIISGTVFQKDGKTPAPNILIYAYHTDLEGFYGRGNGEPPHGKYRGWMLTDKNGKYEFRTIKPAPYPQRKFAAHIHMTLTGENFKEDWIDSILFEGDKLISERERNTAGEKGGFDPILKLEKNAEGILYGIRNIRLY